MNATAAHAHPRHDTRRHASPDRRRRRTVVALVGAAFLGIYVLGITWFAETLNDDMARSFQLAPAVADVEHR